MQHTTTATYIWEFLTTIKMHRHISHSIYLKMPPPPNIHLTFPILHLPDLRLRSSYTVLPLPNAVDTWLSNSPVKICGDCLGPTFVQLGDLPSDQVVCTVQLHAAEASSQPCTGI